MIKLYFMWLSASALAWVWALSPFTWRDWQTYAASVFSFVVFCVLSRSTKRAS